MDSNPRITETDPFLKSNPRTDEKGLSFILFYNKHLIEEETDSAGKILRCKGGLTLLLIGVVGLLVSPLVSPALIAHLQAWTAIHSGQLSHTHTARELLISFAEKLNLIEFN